MTALVPEIRQWHPYSTEVLIYLKSNCQIWWSVWGEPNRHFALSRSNRTPS